jgi:hypothetical protein
MTVIEFNLKDKYMEGVGCRIADYAAIAEGEEQLVGAKELVTPLVDLAVTVDYPFKAPTVVLLRALSDDGFTRIDLLRQVYGAYEALYAATAESLPWEPDMAKLWLVSAAVDDSGTMDLVVNGAS